MPYGLILKVVLVGAIGFGMFKAFDAINKARF